MFHAIKNTKIGMFRTCSVHDFYVQHDFVINVFNFYSKIREKNERKKCWDGLSEWIAFLFFIPIWSMKSSGEGAKMRWKLIMIMFYQIIDLSVSHIESKSDRRMWNFINWCVFFVFDCFSDQCKNGRKSLHLESTVIIINAKSKD